MRRKLLLAFAVLGGVVAWSVGCSSFSSDAAPASSDAGPTADATLPDAEPVSDAGSVDAAFTCPPDAAFCDDFERDAIYGSWEQFVGDSNPGTAKIYIDDTIAASPTRSIRSEPQGAGTRAALYQSAPIGTTNLTIAFSLRTDQPSPTQVHVVTVELEKELTFAQVIMKDGQLMLLEQSQKQSDSGVFHNPANVVAAPVGKFERYVLTVDRANAKFSLATGDGKVLKEMPLLTEHPPVIARYGVGTTFTGGDAAPPHWIDDVVVFAK